MVNTPSPPAQACHYRRSSPITTLCTLRHYRGSAQGAALSAGSTPAAHVELPAFNLTECRARQHQEREHRELLTIRTRDVHPTHLGELEYHLDRCFALFATSERFTHGAWRPPRHRIAADKQPRFIRNIGVYFNEIPAA